MLDSDHWTMETAVHVSPGARGPVLWSLMGSDTVSTRRGHQGAWFVLGLVASWAEVCLAGPVVQLQGWGGEGSVVPGHGQGPDLIQLIAEAEWDPSASRDPSRYQVRVTLPDGRSETRAYPVRTPPGRRRFPVYVPAGSVRNLPPGQVKVIVSVVDAASGATLSNDLEGGIEQFPRPRGDASANDPGPFGWGKPLDGAERILPNPGPGGLTFARIPGAGDSPGFFLATTEATVFQVGERIQGYDPKAGRSDEFSLEAPEQPAVGLTPSKAIEYLKALGQVDTSGLAYRLPTVEEWNRAARGGKTSAFWWGDEPAYPEGANFLGPKPALAGDTTAPSLPPVTTPTFKANPFGLYHTFGNLAEWATVPAGGFARMGGHFRTEPASPLPEVAVAAPEEVGPDPFVGVRPAFELSPESGAALVRKHLAGDPDLARVGVAFDPDRSTVRLTGRVAEAATRRSADRILEGLWFVAAVENLLETPAMAPNQLASLGEPAGPVRRVASNGKTFLEVPISVRWLDPLPVSGSEWWVNIYLPGGGHLAHKLVEGEPGRSRKATAVIDLSQAFTFGPPGDPAVSVALSLGAPSPIPGGPTTASNTAVVRLVPRVKSP
jgi:hypothetical protein